MTIHQRRISSLSQSRHLSVALVLTLSIAAAGCKEQTQPDPAALRAQQALIARRNALLESRKLLQEKRKQIQEDLSKAAASGGDTAVIQRKLEDTDSELEQQNDQLAEEFQALSSKLDSIAVATDQTADVAVREAGIGTREKSVGQREERLATRERDLADRERALAVRERDTCSVAAPVIVQTAPRGISYSRKEIETQLSRARTNMAKRGLRTTDLPSFAVGLEREATKGMTDNDLGKAYLAASQLAATVDSVKIDRAFIETKIGRLQRQIASNGKIDEKTNKDLGSGIAEVMQKWGDGDFAKANAKLNQLYGILR